MNAAHRMLCASSWWRGHVTSTVLPWVLEGTELGANVLEVGPGYGAATRDLRLRVGHLTCVEIDRTIASRLASAMSGLNVTVLCEDATRLSLPDGAYDAAVSLTMLHHVPSAALQDRLFAAVARVLRPGGAFVGFDAAGGPLFRLLHAFDTSVTIDPATLPMRLSMAGFTDITVDMGARGFRFQARRSMH